LTLNIVVNFFHNSQANTISLRINLSYL